jgi:hypothetical protein
VRVATESRDWGYTRLQRAWPSAIVRSAYAGIANSLRYRGLKLTPDRVKMTTRTDFLKAHWDILALADFLTVHVWTGRGLKRLAVHFLIEPSPAGLRSPE